MNDENRNRDLRISVKEGDVLDLMGRFPKLTRTEIVDVIGRAGPIREDVEMELRRLSARKS